MDSTVGQLMFVVEAITPLLSRVLNVEEAAAACLE
jgi:hypothetical protein